MSKSYQGKSKSPTRASKEKDQRKKHSDSGQYKVARSSSSVAHSPKIASIPLDHLIYGQHAIEAAWCNSKRRIDSLYITEDSLKGLLPFIEKAIALNIKRPTPQIVSNQELNRILPPQAVHQGMAIKALPLEQPNLDDIIRRTQIGKSCRLLILDQVTDPHNIGAIMRSAAAFNATSIIVQSRHAPPITAVLAKAACGAVEMVDYIDVVNLSRTIEELKENGFMAVGMDGNTTQEINVLYTYNPAPEKIAMVLGAEGTGMRRLVKESCDILIKLPSNPQMPSVNVSNAAAIGLFVLQSLTQIN
ncbi:MAG: 23S rRNA (guanosine(2251)-2'-O)-methyltransferase RlmB [Alphaproteobacteria bacterium]